MTPDRTTEDPVQRCRTGSFEHKGRQLVYDDYGGGDRVLVYLHGLLLDAELNRGIAEAMADRGNRVVLLDLLGHGRSDSPTHASEYRIDSYAEQVVALLDHLDVERAALGGLSLGANVSLVAAVEHPERVRGLILEMPVMEWAVPAAALAFVPMLLAAHYGRPLLALTSSVMRRVPRTPVSSLNSLLDAASMSPDVMSSILHGDLVGPVVPTTEPREAVQVPALVLAHTNDLIHPFNDARNLAEQLPCARLVRAHSPLELRLRPERLTAELSDFLGDLWSPRTGATA
jgi:pimeloyl-ACP methyl ester carboxylesterase